MFPKGLQAWLYLHGKLGQCRIVGPLLDRHLYLYEHPREAVSEEEQHAEHQAQRWRGTRHSTQKKGCKLLSHLGRGLPMCGLEDCTGGTQPPKSRPSIDLLWFFRRRKTGKKRPSLPFSPDAGLPECRCLCSKLIRSFWKGQFTASLCTFRTVATKVQMVFFFFWLSSGEKRGFFSHATEVPGGLTQ